MGGYKAPMAARDGGFMYNLRDDGSGKLVKFYPDGRQTFWVFEDFDVVRRTTYRPDNTVITEKEWPEGADYESVISGEALKHVNQTW